MCEQSIEVSVASVYYRCLTSVSISLHAYKTSLEGQKACWLALDRWNCQGMSVTKDHWHLGQL